MLKQYKLRFYNFRLIIFLLAISLIGVTLVGTAASDLKSKQFAGVVLGIGRAIGETMAVMMVAGNSTGIPSSIFKGVRTLTTNIAIEMGYAQDLHREALIATGVVLFVFILIINISCSLLKRRNRN